MEGFDLGSIFAHIKADTSDFQKGIKDAQHSLGGLKDGFVDFSKQSAIFAGVVGAGVVAGVISSVKAYNEAEAAALQLKHAVMDVTHATVQELGETIRLSDALEKKGVLDGDNIKVGLAQLSTFGLSNKAVRGLGSSLADLAVNQFGVNASGEQLSQTANMIAKALNGQFGVLEKSGIRFTEAQKAIIATGTEMEKVKAINEGFAQNLKYTNEVALQGLDGKLAQIRVQLGNFQEAIGGVGNAIATVFLNGDMNDGDGRIFDAIQALVPDDDLAGQITDGIMVIMNAFRSMVEWVKGNQEIVITFLKGLGIALSALLVIGTITALVMALTNPLVLVSIAITALYMAWETNFYGMRDVMNNVFMFFQMIVTSVVMPLVTALTAWITQNWGAISTNTIAAWNIIAGVLRTALGIIVGIVTVATALITGDWKSAQAGVKASIDLITGGVQQAFSGIVSFLGGIGGTILDRLTSPFKKAWEDISGLMSKIRDALDFTKRHSPSVIDILNKGVDLANRAYSNLDFPIEPLAPQMSAAGIGAGFGGGATSINIDLSGAVISDDAGAERIAERIGDSLIRQLKTSVRI